MKLCKIRQIKKAKVALTNEEGFFRKAALALDLLQCLAVRDVLEKGK
jgi:hypothetical protein